MNKSLVLIADPEPSVLARVEQVLANDGYTVSVAGSSHDAIELARNTQPELVIINARMPALSGVEAASRIAQTGRCKVLFLSDLAADPDFREMLRGLRIQGCTCAALGVPFEDRDLLSQVRRQIGSTTIAKSSRSRSMLVAAGALILIAICVIILRNQIHSSRPPYSPFAPVASSAKPALPAANAEAPSNTQSTPAAGTMPLKSSRDSGGAPLSTAPRNSPEALTLRAKIEQEGATLREAEGKLSNLNRQIDALKAEINSEQASLREMQRKANRKLGVNESLYESIRQRHDADVRTYNRLLDESKSASRDYKAQLATIKEQIDRYNVLVKSR